MSRGMAVLGSFGLGAGLLFLLDPAHGAERRAALRDSAAEAGSRSSQWWARAAGFVRGLVTHPALAVPSPDAALAYWVRSKMGRVASRPEDVVVDVEGGRVLLAGRLPAREIDGLLWAIWGVRGVRDVENRLELYHDDATLRRPPASRMWSLEVGHA